MSKSKKLRISLVFVICLLSVLFCVSAFADELQEDGVNYTEVPVYVDGLLACRGYTIGDNTCISLAAICNVLDHDAVFTYGTDSESEERNTLTVEVCDIEITVDFSSRYMCANGRYLYLPDGYQEIEGEPVFPIEVIAKLFTLSSYWHEESETYNLDTMEEEILEPAEEFYDENELYWLSRIITWESGNQPLEGQIGVGNVVLNRVADPAFADSIRGVIFQTGQFSVVESGAIYGTPYDISVIAAKLVLEGYNTVGNALFFQTLSSGTSKLFDSRELIVTIADHNFYA